MRSISSQEIPRFENLDESWIERLNVSRKVYRRYCHLDTLERQFVEHVATLARHYQGFGVLQPLESPDGPDMSVCRNIFRHLDARALVHGKGREVDYRAALDVWRHFDRYHQWAQGVSSESTILDGVFPYSLQPVRTSTIPRSEPSI